MPNNDELQKQIDAAVGERLASLSEADFQKMLEANPKLRSQYDARLNKGTQSALETFKRNELPKIKEELQNESGVTEKEKLLDRKMQVLTLATDRGLDPAQAFALLGLDPDATDADRLDAAGDIRQQGRNEFLKENGRTPHVSLNMEPSVFDKLAELPDDMLSRVSDETIAKAEKEMLSEGKKTLGQSLRERFFGGKE